MHRSLAIAMIAVLILGAFGAASPPAVAAGVHPDSCITEVYYETPTKAVGFKGTNEHSFQVGGPGTISWTESGTVTQTFGINASTELRVVDQVLLLICPTRRHVQHRLLRLQRLRTVQLR